MFKAQQGSNLKTLTIIVPNTDERPRQLPLLPQRFSTTSGPTKFSIVPPDLTSVTEPQFSPEAAIIP
jgi:hypothetical protein